MRIAFLTGIWPPDVGGPATHGPDFTRFLVARGHGVHVVTMGDGEPTERPCEVEVVTRRLPFPLRYGLVTLRGARAARRADVVYATATYAAAAAASTLARRPLVAKLVSDPAYERARRYGLFEGTLEEFQEAGARPVRALKAARTRALRRASAIVVPSAYLAGIAGGWGLREERIRVLTNPAPPPTELEPTALEPGTFVFVGRLTQQKALDVAVDAIARVPAARLVVVGDGPERAELERRASASDANGRIEFLGTRSRHEALAIVAGARAALLSSDWENLPHSAVEALSVGVPVVATAVGGVPEVVRDDENGLLVAPRRARGARRRPHTRPRGAGAPRAAGLRREAVGRWALERRGLRAARSRAPRSDPVSERLRALFVGRMRYTLPLPDWLAPKWDAVERELDYRVVGAAAADSRPSDERFHLSRPARPRILDGLLFYLRLPFRLRSEIRTFDPDVVFASDPFLGAAALIGRGLARRRPKVIVEVHGDWKTFTRLYGSRGRRLVTPLADRVAEWAVRRADATRAVSNFTAGLIEEARGVPATAIFTPFSDLSAFAERPPEPLPERPTVISVAALEPYKNTAGLDAAWRRLADRVPEAVLVLVGTGSQHDLADRLVLDFPGRVTHHEWLDPDAVAAAIDDATVLVLPSWPEGLGRVIIEAFARGRGVVATDAGGIPDLVTHEREGLLIPPADVTALAEALERVLTDRELAARLGAAARERYVEWHSTPEELATKLRELAEATVAGTVR